MFIFTVIIACYGSGPYIDIFAYFRIPYIGKMIDFRIFRYQSLFRFAEISDFHAVFKNGTGSYMRKRADFWIFSYFCAVNIWIRNRDIVRNMRFFNITVVPYNAVFSYFDARVYKNARIYYRVSSYFGVIGNINIARVYESYAFFEKPGYFSFL